MAWRRALKTVIDATNRLFSFACHALLGVITIVTVMQVFLRFAVNSPTSWSEEVALLCLVWFGMLAVAIGIRRHEHVAITFLRDRLPEPAAVTLDYFAQLAMGLFMFVVMLYGGDLIALAGAQVLPASLLPKYLLYLPALVGGGLGVVNAAVNILLRDVHRAETEIPEVVHVD
ncbi:TRAP transporter small permease [Labrenzia sp. OB1]|uniref:TRAP transporter small permease n=1 Tax=Labrenzia sp. OB1 TaxID=1561204 RepID=UPI000837C262|nr:TRAP transporter small permease [Labrenzia sp. OB1]